jgi:putative endonuclease
MNAIEDSRLHRAADRRGRRGEAIAILMLLLKGYRILGRRIRTHLGEIDLIARAPSGTVCFVEVKVRELQQAALVSLGPRQQMRIMRAAQLYLSRRPQLGAKGVRFDMVILGARGFPRHVKDAWRP